MYAYLGKLGIILLQHGLQAPGLLLSSAACILQLLHPLLCGMQAPLRVLYPPSCSLSTLTDIGRKIGGTSASFLHIHVLVTVCLQSSVSGCLDMSLEDKLESGQLPIEHHTCDGDQECSRKRCRPAAGSGRLCRLARQPPWHLIPSAPAPLQPSEHPWLSATAQKRYQDRAAAWQKA